MVQIGDKMIDYNEDFKLFMTTRNPAPEIPPDGLAIITEVNFTTTRAGLTGQVKSYLLIHSSCAVILHCMCTCTYGQQLWSQLCGDETSSIVGVHFFCQTTYDADYKRLWVTSQLYCVSLFNSEHLYLLMNNSGE